MTCFDAVTPYRRKTAVGVRALGAFLALPYLRSDGGVSRQKTGLRQGKHTHTHREGLSSLDSVGPVAELPRAPGAPVWQ